VGVERLVDGTLGPAFAIDGYGRVVAVNGAASDLLRTPASRLVGQRCSDVVCAVDGTGERSCRPDGCPTLASLVAGRAIELPWRAWLRPDGTRLPILATALALPAETRSDSTAAVILLHPQATALDNGTAARTGGAENVYLRLFGSPQCIVNGEPVQLPRRRALEVLALLALAPAGGLRKDQVCDALWPEPPGGSERTHLRVLLHSLRQSLGCDVTVSVSAGAERLQLAPCVQVDATAFTRGLSLLRAGGASPERNVAECLDRIDALLSLYAADLDESGVFGAWVTPYQERLRSDYLGLLRDATRLAAGARDPARAMGYCQRAVAADPLQEEFQIALIAAYGQLGRRREALAQYQSYRSALTSDLALEPSSAVERALGTALRAS